MSNEKTAMEKFADYLIDAIERVIRKHNSCVILEGRVVSYVSGTTYLVSVKGTEYKVESRFDLNSGEKVRILAYGKSDNYIYMNVI